MSGAHFFVLTIIAMSLGYGLLKAWINKRPDPRVDEEALSDSMMAKIETLEARIQVLERIITDGRHDLKREIDQL